MIPFNSCIYEKHTLNPMKRKIKVQRKIPPPPAPTFVTPRWSCRNKTRPAGFQSSKSFSTTLDGTIQ